MRLAIEERARLSPDALTGMEATLRFAGPETMETQDLRPALAPGRTGSSSARTPSARRGALTLYGQPERPEFDWKRT